MSSSGLIYAVIVGAWAAYLVPMWLRRQDELNEARPTERFSTAIRLLSGRAGMERRYAKDLRARSAQEGEPDAGDPDAATDAVDVRAFAMPPTHRQARAEAEPEAPGRTEPARDQSALPAPESPSTSEHHHTGAPVHTSGSASVPAPAPAQKRVPDVRRTPPRRRRQQRAPSARRSSRAAGAPP